MELIEASELRTGDVIDGVGTVTDIYAIEGGYAVRIFARWGNDWNPIDLSAWMPVWARRAAVVEVGL